MSELTAGAFCREANIGDISAIQVIRNTVKENILSDPALVTDKDVEEYINYRGRGWVVEIKGEIRGFSIVSLTDQNVWALFVHPDYEGCGIGTKLHDEMMDWYFSKTEKTAWLSTSPGTRAEGFYRKAGWKECGFYGNNEIKFEMSFTGWTQKKNS
jgi:GNAT superfamily N-acetyltransferase